MPQTAPSRRAQALLPWIALLGVACSSDGAGARPAGPASAAPLAPPSLDPMFLGGPGVRIHPRAHVPSGDRDALASAWSRLLRAMTAKDEAAIRELSEGCRDGSSALWKDLPQTRLPETSALWAAGGITIDTFGSDSASGFIGPVLPAMTSLAFERSAAGGWRICRMVAGA